MSRQVTDGEANFKVGTPKYAAQWLTWMDGNIWALTPGEDFTESVAAFRAHCYYMARQYEMKIRTKYADGVLYVQAVLPPAPDA